MCSDSGSCLSDDDWEGAQEASIRELIGWVLRYAQGETYYFDVNSFALQHAVLYPETEVEMSTKRTRIVNGIEYEIIKTGPWGETLALNSSTNFAAYFAAKECAFINADDGYAFLFADIEEAKHALNLLTYFIDLVEKVEVNSFALQHAVLYPETEKVESGNDEEANNS